MGGKARGAKSALVRFGLALLAGLLAGAGQAPFSLLPLSLAGFVGAFLPSCGGGHTRQSGADRLGVWLCILRSDASLDCRTLLRRFRSPRMDGAFRAGLHGGGAGAVLGAGVLGGAATCSESRGDRPCVARCPDARRVAARLGIHWVPLGNDRVHLDGLALGSACRLAWRVGADVADIALRIRGGLVDSFLVAGPTSGCCGIAVGSAAGGGDLPRSGPSAGLRGAACRPDEFNQTHRSTRSGIPTISTPSTIGSSTSPPVSQTARARR